MISKDSIETAYAFLHQKLRVYEHSTLDWQKDDIEMIIGDYADQINPELLQMLSGGNCEFLKNHSTFQTDITHAVNTLEKLLNQQ
jgi:hypothetical protein